MRFRRKLERKVYGLSLIVQRIEEEILYDVFYYAWTLLPGKERDSIKRHLRRIVREELLGKEFLSAIAQDILTETGIQVESHLYQYLRDTLYRGDTRWLLGDLQSILEESQKDEEKSL